MQIKLAQINPTVGALSANAELIISTFQNLAGEGADLVVFPECALTGYPIEDLVLNKAFQAEIEKQIEIIKKATIGSRAGLLFGTPLSSDPLPTNSALLIEDGKTLATFHKKHLPNYDVFDDKRVYQSAEANPIITYKGTKLGILICEDLWAEDASSRLKEAETIIVINASPYTLSKYQRRLALCRTLGKPVYYCNLIGGQDDIIFDGNSFVMNEAGDVQELYSVIASEAKQSSLDRHVAMAPRDDELYKILTLALKDYLHKNGFTKLLLGMSGGIDSALAASIAVDAIGSENVRLIMMPSRYTSQDSIDDADACAKLLGIQLETIPIEPMVASFPKHTGLAAENLQARIRGALLMAISNETGAMVLSTGNKSEYATGYATLYGDMCGGYAILKDVYKTQVFALAKYRKLPENIINKAPTAELRENQKDEDSLPPYDVLDAILENLLENNLSVAEVTAKGFDETVVKRVYRLVQLAEYKRRQSPPGANISIKPFGRDRRYPITNGFINQG